MPVDGVGGGEAQTKPKWGRRRSNRSHTHPHTLKHTPSHPQNTHPHTLTHTEQTHPHTQRHTITHRAHTPSHKEHTHPHTETHTPSHSESHTPSHTPSLPHKHTHSHTLTQKKHPRTLPASACTRSFTGLPASPRRLPRMAPSFARAPLVLSKPVPGPVPDSS